MNDTSAMFEIIDSTVNSSGCSLSVTTLCALAGVSRSGYYAWKAAAPVREKREDADKPDFALILWAYNKRGYTKGGKRHLYVPAPS